MKKCFVHESKENINMKNLKFKNSPYKVIESRTGNIHQQKLEDLTNIGFLTYGKLYHEKFGKYFQNPGQKSFFEYNFSENSISYGKTIVFNKDIELFEKSFLSWNFLHFNYKENENQFYCELGFDENLNLILEEITLKFPDNRGHRKEWYSSGQIHHETFYKNGQLDGTKVEYDKEGNKLSENNYKNGQLDGKQIGWYSYDSKDKVRKKTYEKEFVIGIKHGIHKYWWGNGNLNIQKTYKDGKLDGVTTKWSKRGNKLSENNYKNGQLDGKQFEYDEEGNMERID